MADEFAKRLAELERQGDIMKDLLASEEDDNDLAALLGEASKMIDEGAAIGKASGQSETGYDDDDFEEGGGDESSICSPPTSSAAGTNNPAASSLLTSDPSSPGVASSSPPSSAASSAANEEAAVGSEMVLSLDPSENEDKQKTKKETERMLEDGEFCSAVLLQADSTDAGDTDAGVSMQVENNAALSPKGPKSGAIQDAATSDGDEYDEGFESEEAEETDGMRGEFCSEFCNTVMIQAVLLQADRTDSTGITAKDEGVWIHQMDEKSAVGEFEAGHIECRGPGMQQGGQQLQEQKPGQKPKIGELITVPDVARSLLIDVFNECIDVYDERKRREAEIHQLALLQSHQLALLQSDWMKEDSMQRRIYRVAVTNVARSLLMDVFNECIGAYDERKRREAEIQAELQSEREAGFSQPRECDIRRAEMKKEKLEMKKKRQAEKDRKDAEIAEIAKDKAAKTRQELKENEERLAESQERCRKQREKRERQIEKEKQAMLESNRQRVLDIKKQSEQTKHDIQEFIQMKRKEEAKARYFEKKEIEERDAYRQYQQEVAIEGMRSYIKRQKESKNNSLESSKDGIRAIMHAQAVFEDSLRKNENHMDKMVVPRAETKKQRIDSYVKDVLPIDSGQTGKSYTDALKLTAAIYFSPCESGTLLPQTKKKVSNLTQTSFGVVDGKRQLKADQVISTLKESYSKFKRWRPEGVKSADLVAILRRFNLGAPRRQMERLASEFGIDESDSLEIDDFVEIGLAVFTVVAPDVLVMDKDGQRRSKSAEPLNFGKKSLGDLERSCISALGMDTDKISFTKSQTIKDDLTLHLLGAVKSRKAREREMHMLAQEALEIKRLRENRPTINAEGSTEDPPSAEIRTAIDNQEKLTHKLHGRVNLSKKNTMGKVDVATSNSPVPNAIMGPLPALGQVTNAKEEAAASSNSSLGTADPHLNLTPSVTSKKGSAFSFNKPAGSVSKPSVLSSQVLTTGGELTQTPCPETQGVIHARIKIGADLTTAKSGLMNFESSLQDVNSSITGQTPATFFPSTSVSFAVESAPRPVSRPMTGPSLDRPLTRQGSRQGSRPSSRQTEFREDDVLPTEVLSASTTVGFKFKMPGARSKVESLSLGSVTEGLQPLPIPVVPLTGAASSDQAPVDTSGMSRVQRMKLLQQNSAMASAQASTSNLHPNDSAVDQMQLATSNNDSVQPVPVGEASQFPRRQRGNTNRPF